MQDRTQSFTRAGFGSCNGTRWGPTCTRFRISHPMMCLFSRGNTSMADASIYVAGALSPAAYPYIHTATWVTVMACTAQTRA
jgi:hypothetical protein